MKSSDSMFNQITSNRWFAAGLILSAGLLLSAVAMTLDDDSVPLPGLREKPVSVNQIVPVKRIEEISSNLTKPPVLPLVNGSHPFFTLYFKPAPKVEPIPPTPAPPALKKIALLFQGVYQTADGAEKAFVKVETNLLVLALGGSILNDWVISEISPQRLELTNRAAETTILEFNREKTLEVQEQKP